MYAMKTVFVFRCRAILKVRWYFDRLLYDLISHTELLITYIKKHGFSFER